MEKVFIKYNENKLIMGDFPKNYLTAKNGVKLSDCSSVIYPCLPENLISSDNKV